MKVRICSYKFDGGNVENKKGTVMLLREEAGLAILQKFLWGIAHYYQDVYHLLTCDIWLSSI